MKTVPLDWRQQITHRLATEVGVLGEIIVADALREVGLKRNPPTMEELTGLLRQLRRELPSMVDGARIMADLNRSLVLAPRRGTQP